MLSSFEPRLDVLPASQRDLWPELDAVPSNFVLYGGTALALQLGHRVSVDFDFFSSVGFDPDRLRDRLPFFRDLDPAAGAEVWVHRKRDTLEGYVQRQGSTVKVAFFGGLDNLRRVHDPRRPAGSRVQVASLVDLAGMKLRVIQARANGKIMSTSMRWYCMESTFLPAWRPHEPSTPDSSPRSACVRCSSMETARWLASRSGYSGI
jgi:hypothetical protein